MNKYDTDPEYIPESDEIALLKRHVAENLKGVIQESQLGMAFDLLIQVLFRMYKHTLVSCLIKRSVNITECDIFSQKASEACKAADWSPKTSRTIFSILKKILASTAISKSFIDRITMTYTKTVDPADKFHIYPSAYKYLNNDVPSKIMLSSWIDKIKSNTKNKSPLSVKSILSYYIGNVLPHFNVDIELWPDNPIEIFKFTPEVISLLTKGERKKLTWLQIFVTHILNIQNMKLEMPVRQEDTNFIMNQIKEDNSDKHRISCQELEALYNVVSENGVRDELIYLLLITTGMRIGGLVNIKLEHVATITGKDIEIKKNGRTVEKGSKWFQFILTERVRELIFEWISRFRKGINSPYLFPSRGGSKLFITTSTVRKLFNDWCHKAKIEGDHLHPHALRHSYAHILLESGNSVNIISKLLGHSNTQTTESFYLKESAVDVAKRANIPWLDKSTEKERIVPVFLNKTESKTNKDDIEKIKSERKARARNMASLNKFLNTQQNKRSELPKIVETEVEL